MAGCGAIDGQTKETVGTGQVFAASEFPKGSPELISEMEKLIDETRLPMSEVAFSAGFSSIRRFNAAIRSTYGQSPTELRRTKKQMSTTAGEANLLDDAVHCGYDHLADTT